MDKYGYITMGAQIWADYLGDGHKRLMQVCTKTPDVIKDDSRIWTITVPTDSDDEPEEVMESYPVRADETSPVLKEFDKGYWCAIQNAINNGVGDSTIVQMIKCAGFTYWDCYYLMKDSDFESERLKDVVHTMFCQCPVLMLWEGKGYPTKVVTLFAGTDKEETVEISTATFEKQLMNEDGGYRNEEAVYIDHQIFYYMNDEEFTYPDKDIIEILEDVLK